MKSFNTQSIAKTGFTKSKAYGLCGTLAIATALLIGAGAVSADEATQPVVDTQPTAANVYTADNGGNVTVTPSETVETPAVFTPPAPILEKPELIIEIPSEPVKPKTPNTPDKPSDAPKEKVAQSATVSYKLDSEPKEAGNTTVYGGVLPSTGEKKGIASTLGLVVIAAGITTLGLSFKKYNEVEND